MKASELIIGDWYWWEAEGKKYPLKVTKDTFKLMDEDISNFQPIPLDLDILEKNGFGGNKPKVKLILEDTRELLYHIYEKTLTVYWNRQIVFRSPCTYVHELQHALKLCGIDKEIIV